MHEEGKTKKYNKLIQMIFKIKLIKYLINRNDPYERQLKIEDKFTILISALSKSNKFYEFNYLFSYLKENKYTKLIFF